jgi:hypothetical protein
MPLEATLCLSFLRAARYDDAGSWQPLLRYNGSNSYLTARNHWGCDIQPLLTFCRMSYTIMVVMASVAQSQLHYLQPSNDRDYGTRHYSKRIVK